jgi:hypothetical protein
MPAATETPMLEMHAKVWKARAEAKQKWLERTLASPVNNPQDAQRRSRWIKRALRAVKRGQDEIKYQAALTDALAQHLSVLEMNLMGAIEGESGSEKSRGDRHD